MTPKQPHVSIKDNKRIDFDIKNTKDCINKENIDRHVKINTSVFQIISSLLTLPRNMYQVQIES